MHRQNIEYIIKNGTPGQMEDMQTVLEDAVSKLKTIDRKTYNDIEFCLHKIAHNGHIGEKAAKAWVDCMKNKDGSTGPHWTWEQVAQVKRDKAADLDMSDFFVVLNMCYSDYYSPKFDLYTYVEMAKDWLKDADSGKDKLLKYYYYVIKG